MIIVCFGGGVPLYTVTAEPPAPMVGQQVTFTLLPNSKKSGCYYPNAIGEKSNLFPEGGSSKMGSPTANFTGTTTDDGGGNMLIDMSSKMGTTYTYTYSKAGTYSIDFECATYESKPAITSSKIPLAKAITPFPNVGMITVSPAANIPTLSQWGLIILTIAFSIVGIVSILSKRESHKLPKKLN